MGSSRLPGKVLADVNGVPALTRVFKRLALCQEVDEVVLATTTSPADDQLVAWAKSEGFQYHRGSEEDVLQRVVHAQQSRGANLVVEVTGDCPLLDPDVIDMGIRTFLANDCDVVTNVRLPGFPLGADVQVFPLDLLADVEAKVNDPAVREHVSLYFYEHPERYKILHLLPPPRWHHPKLRLQLDYPEDLRFIREVYSRLEPRYGDAFGLEEILTLLREVPSLADLNAHCVEKEVR
jgi:spore coat polysaccharide biosynthesis protein SpsF